MPTLSSIIQIGRSALRSQQISLNVTGDNIANVNTPGYSRKTAELTSGITVAGLGTGVEFAALTRARDLILDRQFRFENGVVGRLESLENSLSAVEAIFTEVASGGAPETGAVFDVLSGAAISGSLNRLFNSFQDLANNPESLATRAAVREEAGLLTGQFHRMHDQMTEMRTDLENEFRMTVDEVNRLTREIANLNQKIVSEKGNNHDIAGDLNDQRDQLIDELSGLIDVRVREESDGSVTVSGAEGKGITFVQGATATELATRQVVIGNAQVSLLTLGNGGQITYTTGKLKGIEEARDEIIPRFQDDLDTLAETLVNRVNTVHAAGFGLDGSTGNLFFVGSGTTARTMQVSDTILGDLNKITTGGPSEANSSISAGTGDGSAALAISGIRLEKILGGGTQTLEEFYSNLVGQVGAESRSVIVGAEGQRIVMEQVTTRRENVRGVSVNEEASNLILFQRAYQAAARLVTIADEMYQTVLNI